MIYARIEFFDPTAAEDDGPIRRKRVVGESGTVSLAVGAAIHDLEPGETIEVTIEQVELQEG